MSMDALAQEYWELGLKTSPLMATVYGIAGYDAEIGDPSLEADAASTSVLQELAQRIEAAEFSDVQERITKQMLLEAIERDLDGIKYDGLGDAVSPLIGPHSSLLRVVGQSQARSPEQADDLLARYEKVGDWLRTIAGRFVAAAEAGRTHTTINVQHVIGQVDAYLASPLESDPFVTTEVLFDFAGEAEWREQLREVVEHQIRPAMAYYGTTLRDVVLPVARPDEKPGLLHVPNGLERYGSLLKGYSTTELTAEEIHNIGLEQMEQLHAEFSEVGRQAFGIEDSAEVIDRLRNDPALKYSSEEEMLDAAEATIRRAEAAVSEWFNVYPEAKCAVLPVEPELAPSMPPAYYMPPTQDGTRGGTYFLNTYEPTTRGSFDAEAIAFHEAVPGHHFDRSISGELTDIPMFRKLGNVTAFTEGWGLYSERLADEMGLYSSQVARLGMVSSDAWRAGRLVVDTGIHAKGWSRQEAIDYLVANTPIAEGVIATEVDRYIAFPGQAVRYMIGRLAIDKQRKRGEEALGTRFDLKGFHDIILTNGAIPLSVLEDLVGEWIAS